MRNAVIFAAALSVIICITTSLTDNKKSSPKNLMQFGYEIKIVNSNKAIGHKYYEGIQFIVPQNLKGRTDWHDYASMKADAVRKGYGEQGKPTFSKRLAYKYRGKNFLKEFGLNTIVSDLVSINRSLPDTRKLRCREKRYISQLPSVSVIIVCGEEYPSVLKRTLHSIINRSPGILLMEIIIVHMYEDRNFWRSLEKYASLKFPGLVKFIYLRKPRNEVVARQVGAISAKATVLVFLSPHIECNYNWLPPLLEPIALNNKTVTLPARDIISPETLAYKSRDHTNSRVGFDWNLSQQYLPLLLPLGADKTLPYKDIIMSGELFAVDRHFFQTLGGFDEYINSFADELYEFSFKTWMCGGQILTVPCSRVGVINLRLNKNLKWREENKKRIAEIWMDNYKSYVYASIPTLYESIDPGDLSMQKKLRRKLNCRPFQWYLNAVAPDVLEINPPISKPDLAWGMLRLVSYPDLCIGFKPVQEYSFIALGLCPENEHELGFNQNLRLSSRGNIQLMHKNLCLEAIEAPPNSTVYLLECHYKGNSQSWIYDRYNKFLIHKKFTHACLDIIEINTIWKAVLNECDPNNLGMKWTFDNINEAAMAEFEENVINEEHWL